MAYTSTIIHGKILKLSKKVNLVALVTVVHGYVTKEVYFSYVWLQKN